jgi:hypothetical protein
VIGQFPKSSTNFTTQNRHQPRWCVEIHVEPNRERQAKRVEEGLILCPTCTAMFRPRRAILLLFMARLSLCLIRGLRDYGVRWKRVGISERVTSELSVVHGVVCQYVRHIRSLDFVSPGDRMCWKKGILAIEICGREESTTSPSLFYLGKLCKCTKQGASIGTFASCLGNITNTSCRTCRVVETRGPSALQECGAV